MYRTDLITRIFKISLEKSSPKRTMFSTQVPKTDWQEEVKISGKATPILLLFPA